MEAERLSAASPEIAVVVASHDRALRLRWLLEALDGQTLRREHFEVVVAHDSRDATAGLLERHPLAPRVVAFAPGSAGPAAKRNAGWRATRAPLVAFTDDDCRPRADWLEEVLAAARQDPGSVIQGATIVDDAERPVRDGAAWARSQQATPPTPFAQTCNITYPRVLLDQMDGFDERLPLAAGEDTDLWLRARESGARLIAAPDALVEHAVFERTLSQAVRGTWRWQHVAAVPARHPQIRSQLVAGLFWREAHGWLLLGLAGLMIAARRRPAALALAAPWLRGALAVHGRGARARVRATGELPGRAVLDLAETAAAARGAVRYRTPFL